MISTRGGWLRVDRHGERLQFVAKTKLSSRWGLVQCRHDVPVVPAQVLILMILFSLAAMIMSVKIILKRYLLT